MIKRLILFFVFISSLSFSQNPLWDSVKPGFGFDIPQNIYIDTFQNKAIVYGGFKYFGTSAYNDIFSYDGTNVDSLGNGLDGTGSSFGNSVFTVCSYKGKLYVGGAFQVAGGKQIPWLATWDGTNWDSLPFGCPNTAVGKMKIYNNELYITGAFTQIGGQPTQYLMKWDGTTLTTYPSLPYSLWQTSSMEVYNNELYFGGDNFIMPPNNSDLVKFDGVNWSVPGVGVPGNGISSLKVYNNKLYIGGQFTISQSAGDYLITWDGMSYNKVLDNIDSWIMSLEVYNGKLLVGGCFQNINNVHTGCLVAIDSLNFCRLGFPISGCMQTIRSYNGTFLIGGGFTLIDTTNFNCLAEWDGANYTDTCAFAVGVKEYSLTENSQINIYPNPANNSITVSFDAKENSYVELYIYNSLGEIVSQKQLGKQSGEIIHTENISDLPSGIYFLKIQSREKSLSKKFIKQ